MTVHLADSLNDFCFMCNDVTINKYEEVKVRKNISLNEQVIKTTETYYKVCPICMKKLLTGIRKLDKINDKW